MSTLSILLILFQGCLPDSIDKWSDAGEGGDSVSLIDPPSSLAYTGSPFTYSKDIPVATLVPTVTTPVGYPVTLYSISPSLDDTGLTFNVVDGSISGSPSDYLTLTTYTITATNSGGSDTTTIQIQVPVVIPTSLAYDSTLYYYPLDTDIGTGPVATLLPVNSSTCIYSISPEIEDDNGLEFNTTTGGFSGSPAQLTVNQLSGTMSVTNAGTAVIGTSSYFSSELVVGAKVIFYDSSGNPQQCADGICEIATITDSTNLILSSNYSGATESGIAVKSLGKVYTVRATTDTSTSLGSYQEDTLFIGVDSDSLAAFTYPQSSYSLPREYTISDIEPTTTLGDEVTYSIEVTASPNIDAEKRFAYETGLSFDTTTGIISGTTAPAVYLSATVASAAAITARCDTTPVGTVYTCDDPIEVSSDTSPITYAYIYSIDTSTNTISIAVKSPTKITALANLDTLSDSESLGFSQSLAAVTPINTPNGDRHGYLASQSYTVYASDNIGNKVSRDITISVIKAGPSTLTYSSILSFTNGDASNPIGPTSLSGDAFNLVYGISPSLNSITGLTFDTTSGEISGTPTSISPAVNYTITVTGATDSDGITPFTSSSSTSTTVSIGVYEQLSTDLQYSQSRTIMVDIANLSAAAPTTAQTVTLINAAAFTGTIDNVSSDDTQVTFTKDSTYASSIVDIGDTITFSGGTTATIVAITNVYSVGETISLSPQALGTGTPESYEISTILGITWDATAGTIIGTMTSDFTAQTYTIYGKNPVSQTNSIAFSIAGTSEEPEYLNYSNVIALNVGDTTSFVVGGSIAGKDASDNKAYGIVRKVSADENLLLIKVTSGTFTDEMSIDNTEEFFSEETTTSDFYILKVDATDCGGADATNCGFAEKGYISGTNGGIGYIRHIDGFNLYVQVLNAVFIAGESVDNAFGYSAQASILETQVNGGVAKDEPAKANSTVLLVADASDFDIGGYVSTAAGAAIGIINYVDNDSDEIYTRIVKGTFADGNTVYNSNDGTGTSTTVTSVESANLIITLSAGVSASLTEGGDFTTSNNEVGLVHEIDSTTSVDISVTQNLFDTGGNVDNANPYSATIGATVSAVAHNHAFYLYARESANIAPTINKGNVNATYSISPSLLPDGLTFSTSTGSITGTPTGSFPEQSYTVTATSIIDVSVTATFTFSIKVYDYIELTNHTEDAASFVLHKEGQSNNTQPCRILADHLDVDSAPTVMCLLEAGELDLHQQGLTLGTSAGAGICDYVRFVPFYYNRYEYIVDTPSSGLNNDTSTFVTYGQSGNCTATCTDSDLTTNFPVAAANCPQVWGAYYMEQDTGTTTDAGTPQCAADYGTYADCSEGSYVTRSYTCTELDPSGSPGDCTCSYTESSTSCTGEELNCKDGPAIGFGDIDNRPDMGKTIATFADGANINNWDFTAPASQLPYQSTNLSLANYTNSNSCSNGTYSYHHYSWQGYAQTVNAQDPFGKTSNSVYGPVNPFYTLYCLDESHNVKGKILLQVREWDKAFDVSDNIDQIVPASDMDNISFSNYYDWDDFYAPDPTAWTPVSLPTLPTLAAGSFVPSGVPACGTTVAGLTGDVDTTVNTTLIDGSTGVATLFTAELSVGDAIEITGATCGGKSYCIVDTIVDNTTLYLELPVDATLGNAAIDVRAQPGITTITRLPQNYQ